MKTLIIATLMALSFNVHSSDTNGLSQTTQVDEDTSFTWFFQTVYTDPEYIGPGTEKDGEVGFYWTWNF